MTQWADIPRLCVRCSCHTSGHRPDNPAYDRYCDLCAVAMMRRDAQRAKIKRRKAAQKRNNPHLHPHPAHAAYLRKLALEDASRED